MRVEPSSIRVEDEVLSDLRGASAALAATLDWGAQERELNAFDHFRAELGGGRILFVHVSFRR